MENENQLIEVENHFPHDFTFREFTYDEVKYKVALTPQLYGEEDGVDFTGNYVGILISERLGTISFELEPDVDEKWTSENKLIDLGLVEVLDGIIGQLRK